MISLDNFKEEIQIKQINKCIYGIDKFLEDAGWEYDENGIYIPYNDDIYLHISRNLQTRKNVEIIFAWAEKISDNEYKDKRSFTFDTMLNMGNKKKINELIKLISSSGEMNHNPGDEEDYTAFTNDIIDNIIDSNFLTIFKNINYDEPVLEEEEPDDDIVEDNQDKTFDDYDDIIKEEALQLLEQDDLFNKVKSSISLTHEGNNDLKNRLPLILASIFVAEPIHTEMNADSGTGKTDSAIETAKNFPEQYVNVITNISPKNMYYDRDSYGEYNIVIFDDLELTDEIIKVLKELSDNKKPIKKLKTVLDGKAVEFELPGRYLVILTYAKNNPDEELLNRLYKLNIIVTDDDSSKIKDKILNNAIIDSDNNEIIYRNRLIISAAIQYLVDKEIKVFNPFTLLFNPHEYRNRNINPFVSFVKSKTFFHSLKRKIVEVNGEKYCIGSFEDYNFVKGMWQKDNRVQKYKLNDKQIKILDILPEKSHTEAYEDCDEDIKSYIKASSDYDKNKILEEQYTRKRISRETNINENTVRNYIDKSSGTAKTLLDYGLVKRIPFKIAEVHSPYIYYKVKIDGEDSDSDNSDCHDCQIEYDSQINTLYYKINVIYTLFCLSNIVLNEAGFFYLLEYCHNYETKIKLNDYDSYYNFINNAITDFDFNKYSINLSEAKYSDIEYMANIEEEIAKLNGVDEKEIRSFHDFLTGRTKSKEKEYGDKSTSKVTVKSEMTPDTTHQILHKGHIDENKYDLAVFNKIGNILYSTDLTIAEIQNEIKKDSEDIKFLDDKVKVCLSKMEEDGYVSMIFEKNVAKYRIENKLKEYLSMGGR